MRSPRALDRRALLALAALSLAAPAWVARADEGAVAPAPDAPVVKAMVLRVGGPGTDADVDAWIAGELKRRGVGGFWVEEDWFRLTDQARVVFEGRSALAERLAPARDPDVLSVQLDGPAWGEVSLPRRDGAVGLLRYVPTADVELYLAFHVERAGPSWPAPLEIGPEADGQVVEVADAREVVIALPGDRSAGRAWTVVSISGDPPPVEVTGAPQFVPAVAGGTEGTFEAVLRVEGAGTSVVALEYRGRRGAPEKTFRTTLRIVEPRAAVSFGEPDAPVDPEADDDR